MGEHLESYIIAEVSREGKIKFCYELAARLGEEVEQPFEDFLEEGLDKAFNYYWIRGWDLSFKDRYMNVHIVKGEE